MGGWQAMGMWPWGHVAVAYLAYVLSVQVRGREQRPGPVIGVVVGSQLPDLVDKPLAWTLPVLPSGRSLMHSVLTAAVVVAVTYWIGRRVKRAAVAGGLGIGLVSHSVVDLGPDVVLGVVQGQWEQVRWTTYLLWPLLPAPPYPHDNSFAYHFASFALDPYMLVQVGLFVIAVTVWFQSGAPGTGPVQHRLRGWLARERPDTPRS